MTEQKPVRLPDPGSVETVLAALEPQSADVELAPALTRPFRASSSPSPPSTIPTGATLTTLSLPTSPASAIIAPGSSMNWPRSAVTSTPSGTGIVRAGKNSPNGAAPPPPPLPRPAPASPTSCRSRSAARSEFLAGAVVDPDYRPRNVDDLFEPTWVLRGSAVETQQLAGPVYRLRGRRHRPHARFFGAPDAHRTLGLRHLRPRASRSREIGFTPRPLKMPTGCSPTRAFPWTA